MPRPQLLLHLKAQFPRPQKLTSPLPSNLKVDDASPNWLNKGDNAWQLTAATLVGLQSVPGLVILYGSIVKKKWAVNSAFMALYAFAAVLVCWMGWGFSFMLYLPNATMVYFQVVFAAITLILIAGALLGRMNFYAWMLFVPLWLTFSYTIYAFSIWSPNGWLSKSVYSALFSLSTIPSHNFWLGHKLGPISKQGPRAPAGAGLGPGKKPGTLNGAGPGHGSCPAGAGLLWMGWTGFNGGDPYTVSVDASLAVLNSHVCTATSLLTWLLLDILFFGKPSVIGATQGMVNGLVCITPAAGVVQGWAAIIMGIMSGSIPWYTMMVLHKRSGLLKQVDDTMAVFHAHAVAGSLGGILAGVFAEPKLCRLFCLVDDWEHYVGFFNGLHDGNPRSGVKQLRIQLLGIVIICNVVGLVVPLRLSEEELQTGDDAIHGEEAYALWGDGEKERFANSKLNLTYGDNFPTKGEVQRA
ncbi:hypothetical protein RGQ29_009132 [Quercus rubra]|uniref:Ammonium transporter AmtB-like domain-containing protein n=1 Tax=Quercus rubra TaxID=3512 RepID=A0AAN7I9I0_QUERU|nr:hypothetical protein RGQ29_009132 [Quercus rubra]